MDRGLYRHYCNNEEEWWFAQTAVAQGCEWLQIVERDEIRTQMCPKTDCRDMNVFLWLHRRYFHTKWDFLLSIRNVKKKTKKKPWYIWPSLYLSIFFFSVISLLYYLIEHCGFLPLIPFSVLFNINLVVSSSTRNKTGMQHIHPFRGLSQNTTHHYCHSLFQSCCYILKTLGACVVLIPDYSPAQVIKQGQTPFTPLYSEYYNVTCPELTDAAFSPEFRVYLQSLCQHLCSHVPHGVPTDVQLGERGVAPKRVQHDGQITL